MPSKKPKKPAPKRPAQRGKQHDDVTRAAVMAALLAGQGVGEVAASFRLPQTTVSSIKAAIPPERFVELRSKKEKDFADALDRYLTATFESLIIQAQHFSDKTWLNKQNAADLAMLHGVQTDKAIRLLEAIERANAQATAETESGAGGEIGEVRG